MFSSGTGAMILCCKQKRLFCPNQISWPLFEKAKRELFRAEVSLCSTVLFEDTSLQLPTNRLILTETKIKKTNSRLWKTGKHTRLMSETPFIEQAWYLILKFYPFPRTGQVIISLYTIDSVATDSAVFLDWTETLNSQLGTKFKASHLFFC